MLMQIADSPSGSVANIPANYTEALAGSYTLPDPLKLASGKAVKDAKTWNTTRRPEILHLFEQQQFGRMPGRPKQVKYDVFDKGTPALDGKAIRRQVTLVFSPEQKVDVVLYLPAGATRPSPVLLNAAFSANSNTVEDAGIRPGEVWNPKDKKRMPASAARRFGSLKVEPFLAAGIGVATVYYGDFDPDFDGGLGLGVRSLYPKPGPEEWGTISAWAWGLSRVLDYLETDTGVDARRVALTGVSRLGKTVLWAGAHDQRFAAVIASCSGEGGAALSRRDYGETVAHLVAPTRYAYQFAANYGNHAAKPRESPVDGHLLLSLIAPRPLLLQTGDTDKWSDPYGEFLAAVAAGPVYRLLGQQDLGVDKMPRPGEAILNTLGFLIHAGGHGTIPADWPVFVEFLKRHL